jgi:hypothetical protein
MVENPPATEVQAASSTIAGLAATVQTTPAGSTAKPNNAASGKDAAVGLLGAAALAALML